MTESSFVLNYLLPVMNDLTEMSNAKSYILEQKTVDCATTEPNGFSRSFTRYHSASAQASVCTEVFKHTCEIIVRM